MLDTQSTATDTARSHVSVASCTAKFPKPLQRQAALDQESTPMTTATKIAGEARATVADSCQMSRSLSDTKSRALLRSTLTQPWNHGTLKTPPTMETRRHITDSKHVRFTLRESKSRSYYEYCTIHPPTSVQSTLISWIMYRSFPDARQPSNH
ncbi:uncharacterized protein B0I36DRAFT_319316 [Microdochium trichocladiopsis]|uniref:Uncharacterized protein n=1 Tax=Microdochium trichocladiopsis TaxID=1682393 RepID=A0A9P9BTS3_9PEZI|nr:uncharacterized protein B0I36DRAFT_319316 [Microdochium trichocladiopsis]KAH7035894.1 hypothetical protein B0I36DRAFT_319316 [Microdochium trichocladiopsis]